MIATNFTALVARLKASWTEPYEGDDDPYGPVNMAHLMTDGDREQFCFDLEGSIEEAILEALLCAPFFVTDSFAS